jgi:crotonobetainyl-CoA:carnitine CoA-transferase CaiB-like acyl-CoA transferase
MTEIKRRTYKSGRGALNGVRILDLSRLVAGNVLTQMLADFGAEVIKVEPPAGDTLRGWKTQGISVHWKIYSRGKKSLCLDLKSSKAVELLCDLAADSDMFIESFRPGTLESMGLSPNLLHARNPKLVIVRISGWGQDGPYRRRPGFGTLVEGMSGFAAMNGFADREPVLPPMYLADSLAGLTGAAAAMIALREVETNGGNGQIIDMPLFDPLFTALGPHAAIHRLSGVIPPRTGSRSNNSAPRNAFCCNDGAYVAVSASTEKMAHRLLRAIGRPDMVDDPRFATNTARLENVGDLEKPIAAFIAQRTLAENMVFFEAAEVTIGPIYDIAQIVEDPHVLEREVIASYPDPEMGELLMHHVVPRLSGTPGAIGEPAPALGQHNFEILRRLGVDECTYAELLAQGVVAVSSIKEGH